MTREEAIKHLSNDLFVSAKGQLCVDVRKKDEFMDAIGISIDALRPVSRERVEKVWRGEWLHDPETGCEHCDKCSHTISLDDYVNRKPPLFCEMCGDAKTDEAVEMVMKRLEALHGQENS